tara:strand:- start:542 stop:823 length:282 start_codon:yes stop_codon:yes gene_type:complete
LLGTTNHLTSLTKRLSRLAGSHWSHTLAIRNLACHRSSFGLRESSNPLSTIPLITTPTFSHDTISKVGPLLLGLLWHPIGGDPGLLGRRSTLL